MKFNERELALVSNRVATMEGRMTYKRVYLSNQYYQAVSKDRWFKLVDNFLFYFRINDAGKTPDKQLIGLFVLENVSILPESEQEAPFAFSLSFQEEPDKKHIFSCMSEASVNSWVDRIKCSSYGYLRMRLYCLQSQIYTKTGKDPLLMVPRNPGSMHWAPEEPKPVRSDVSVKHGPSFKSHIASPAVVYRSKSSANVANQDVLSNGKADFESSWPGCSGVERSKTTANIPPMELFDSLKLYNRPAPSPPPRKKNSPNLSRPNNSDAVFYDMDSLCEPPVPPQRRNSPKLGGKRAIDNAANSDLIQF